MQTFSMRSLFLWFLFLSACSMGADLVAGNESAQEYDHYKSGFCAQAAVTLGVPFARCIDGGDIVRLKEFYPELDDERANARAAKRGVLLSNASYLRSDLTAAQFVALSRFDARDPNTNSLVVGNEEKNWPTIDIVRAGAFDEECNTASGAMPTVDADNLCFKINGKLSVEWTMTDLFELSDNFRSWVCEQGPQDVGSQMPNFRSGGLGFRLKDCDYRFYDPAAATDLFRHAAPLACSNGERTTSTLGSNASLLVTQNFSHYLESGTLKGRHLALDLACAGNGYDADVQSYAAATGLINYAGQVLSLDKTSYVSAILGSVILEYMDNYGRTRALAYFHLDREKSNALYAGDDLSKLVRAGDALAPLAPEQDFVDNNIGTNKHLHFSVMDDNKSHAVLLLEAGKLESYDRSPDVGFVPTIADPNILPEFSIPSNGYFLHPANYFFRGSVIENGLLKIRDE